jgi:glycosyltransferase involved in cell wall biosynthesis
MSPTISVCIPTYNGAKYLRECLDSVLAQTFRDFEVLIVDDQSRDETLVIAQEYAARDTRIKIFQNPQNLGLVGNWNHCIELAQGEWIKFVFQDDLIAPTCLEKLLLACDESNKLVFCRREFIFEDGISKKIRLDYTKVATPEDFVSGKYRILSQDFCRAAVDHFLINFVGEPTVVMIRKCAFDHFGHFNCHLVHYCDLEMWIRIAINTDIIHVPEVLASFRVHSGSTTAKNYSDREFRLGLDKIILLHEYAFHPLYANIRIACKRWWKPIDLLNRFKQNAYFAWIDVSRAKKSNVAQDRIIFKDWEQLLTSYPNLEISMNLALSEKIRYLVIRRWNYTKWQFKQFYESQFNT